MDFILKQLTPLQGISYLEDYFEQRRQVAIDFTCYRSSPFMLKFATIDGIMTLQAAHFLYQYFRKFSQLEVVIHGDYTTVACLTREVYLFVAALCLASAYIIHLLYLPGAKDDTILSLLFSLLIEQKSSKLMIDDQGQIRAICRFSLATLNIFNQFGLIIFVFCLTTQAVLVVDLLEIAGPRFWIDCPFYWAGVLLLTELRLTLLYAVLYLFAHAHILLAVLWIVSLRMISTKLKLLCTVPSSSSSSSSSFRWILKSRSKLKSFFTNFKVDMTRTLLLVLSSNRFFAPVLVVFLAINCPLNGILVALLILGRIPLLKAAFVGPVALEEFIFIFGIHFLIGKMS